MGAPLLLTEVRDFSLTYPNLNSIAGPSANAGNQPEAQPWVLFDTQKYVAAGTAKLSFFQANSPQGDPTLTNFANGMLNAKYFYEIHRVHLWIHSMPNANATTAITGAAQDVEILHKTARGTMNASLNARPYLPFPIWYFGRPGGPVPTYSGYGTGTVANNVITTGETESNGGFPVLGNLIIPPAVNFAVDLLFNSTAISADTNISIGLMGILHRPL